MGSFINFTDVDTLNGVFGTPGGSSVIDPSRTNRSQDEFNQSDEVTQRFQPLNEFGGELIERYRVIDQFESEVEARQQADELLTEVRELAQDPTEENLAAAEDILNEVGSLSYTNSSGQSEQVISNQNLTRIQFDIPGGNLDRLNEALQDNSSELEQARRDLNSEEADLQRFIENQGVQTGQTFTQQGDVVSNFLNVEITGQLLDLIL